ncbi:Hypothetical predicted protein [Podarcis lilfordi]|uniref:Uncharacterized protein n=1 Tax=Podarcis lilfordi TaxID=74358 RepID=A0AA35PBY1_9SAUR|nr:Hypothetical predicted protein [Podarcis lilfordi]
MCAGNYAQSGRTTSRRVGVSCCAACHLLCYRERDQEERCQLSNNPLQRQPGLLAPDLGGASVEGASCGRPRLSGEHLTSGAAGGAAQAAALESLPIPLAANVLEGDAAPGGGGGGGGGEGAAFPEERAACVTCNGFVRGSSFLVCKAKVDAAALAACRPSAPNPTVT